MGRGGGGWFIEPLVLLALWAKKLREERGDGEGRRRLVHRAARAPGAVGEKAEGGQGLREGEAEAGSSSRSCCGRKGVPPTGVAAMASGWERVLLD